MLKSIGGIAMFFLSDNNLSKKICLVKRDIMPVNMNIHII